MADINDIQAVTFCNTKLRMVADVLQTAVESSQTMTAYWNAHPELGTLFTNNMSGKVLDGAATDGRPIITGNDVLIMIGLLNTLVSEYAANSNQNMNGLLRVAVNGKSIL
jgi:predicted TPR repeat methyltransferase